MGRPRKNEQMPEGIEETNEKVVPLIASEDVVLKKGRVTVPTWTRIEAVDAMVVSTSDNATHGFLAEGGRRVENCFVVAMSVTPNSDVTVVVDVRDDVSLLRQTQYGTRMDSLIIPSGTHVADLVLL